MNAMASPRVSRNSWGTLLVRGIIAVLFGIAAFIWPGLTLLFLITLFGVYALIDGIIAVFVSVQERNVTRYWWILLLEGIAGIIIGILTFIRPGGTAIALLFLIAAWAIITGIFEIAAAFSRRTSMAREWTLALSGVLSIILGGVVVCRARGWPDHTCLLYRLLCHPLRDIAHHPCLPGTVCPERECSMMVLCRR